MSATIKEFEKIVNQLLSEDGCSEIIITVDEQKFLLQGEGAKYYACGIKTVLTNLKKKGEYHVIKIGS